tara:strand:+ start:35484 stop:36110 length:627 start_codon:yes stop_codon:yes gene_type:complete
MKLIKNEWEVQRIGKSEADNFVEQWHYAHKAGYLAHRCYGLFYKGDPSTLHGVAIWNTPALGAAKYVSNNHQSVLGLSRFCLVENRPENAGSFLISKSIKMLNTKRWQTLLTYADTAHNHNGGLYRASNWDYNGITKKNPYYVNDKGEMVSRKSGAKTYNKQEMLDKGYIFKGNFSKHMFIYPTNRNIRKSIGQQIELSFTEEGKIKI